MDLLYIYSAFKQNADGSWTCVAPITIHHPNGRVQLAPGTTVARDKAFMGVKLAEWLDENRPPGQSTLRLSSNGIPMRSG
jgi:hypothetical protein